VTLIEFLKARLDEDERRARDCAVVYPSTWEVEDRGYHAHVVADGPNFLHVTDLEQEQAAKPEWVGDRLQHIAHHDPARVLREVAAKRMILELRYSWNLEAERYPEPPFGHIFQAHINTADAILRTLASVYSDHPDYRTEWDV
jgi:hypothetical protein